MSLISDLEINVEQCAFYFDKDRHRSIDVEIDVTLISDLEIYVEIDVSFLVLLSLCHFSNINQSFLYFFKHLLTSSKHSYSIMGLLKSHEKHSYTIIHQSIEELEKSKKSLSSDALG